MLETPVQTSGPATVSEGSPERDDAASSSTDATVAEYLASLSGPARKLFDEDTWDSRTDDQSSEKAWDFTPTSKSNENDLKVKYSTLPSKKFSSSSSSTSSQSKGRPNRKPVLPQTSTVRLSSFGAEKVCPVPPKRESSQETCRADFIPTYSFREDSVPPFSWMTRSSHQDVDSGGRPGSATSDELNDNSLEVVATTTTTSRAPSGARHSQLIRQSKGNPSFAKKVNIPIVPHLPKLGDNDGDGDGETVLLNRLNRSTSNQPPVSPHRINNFVYESSPNRLILDFGDTPTELDIWSPRASSPVSGNGSECSSGAVTLTTSSSNLRSQTGLVAKMKETKATLQRTISGTMTRRKKHKSGSAAQSHAPDSSSSLPPSSNGSNGTSTNTVSSSSLSPDKKTASLSSLQQTAPSPPPPPPSASSRLSQNGTLRSVRKPSGRPPPPPPSISRPHCAPPPPPPPSVISAIPSVALPVATDANVALPTGGTTSSARNSYSSAISSESFRGNFDEPKSKKPDEKHSDEIETTLEEFKIDLSTESEFPKTGFDFLDNW